MPTPSFGFLLPTREIAMEGDRPDVGPIIALAEQAEALGFGSIWVGDSLLARPRLDALTTLAAVAMSTTGTLLGTAVYLPALRHPVVLANEAANVDLLSEGRLILGVGIAARMPAIEAEFEECGVPYRRRIGVFEECIEVVRQLWSEPAVTHEGRHFRLDGVRLGVRPRQEPSIPLWLTGPPGAGQSRVLRLGDGWVANPASTETYAEHAAALDQAAAEAGRPADSVHRCVYTTLRIDEDAVRAERDARAFIEGYYDAPFDSIVRHQGVCHGSPEICAAWLQGFVRSGARTIIIRLVGPGQEAQLERCANEVLPLIIAAS
jgi:alkanesulfonate monooxygenase SsuD/methylene tetrahydromethanopterin reductase-like flavin-dependent oxidoreductase (luciferase family)